MLRLLRVYTLARMSWGPGVMAGELPVVGLRLLDGRVGSTLLAELLATDPEVAIDRTYPCGERRYLSYCARVAATMAKPFDPEVDVGVTELFFGDDSRVGPLPFVPGFDVLTLEEPTLAFLWSTMSNTLRSVSPSVRCYSEKLAVSIDRIVGAGIPLQVIDVVRDPRDVLASIRAVAPRIGGGFDRSPGDSELSYVDRFIARLAARLDAMLETSKGIDRITVRYEDLVRDLACMALRVSEWAGLALDVARLEPIADSPERRAHVTSTSPSASIGRWKRDLSAFEADEIARALEDRMGCFGYQL